MELNNPSTEEGVASLNITSNFTKHLDPSAPPNLLADAVFRSVKAQVTTTSLGLVSLVPLAHIPLSEIYYRLTTNDQHWILAAFSRLVNAPSQCTVVPACDKAVLHLVGSSPGQDAGHSTNSDKSIARAVRSKVPRPLNAFMLYRLDHQDEIKQRNPGIKNNDVSRIIGRQWKLEPKAIIDYYYWKAKRAKMEHLLLYPNYQYRPRRPEEKKRRMTKNKQRKLMEKLAAEEKEAKRHRVDPTILGNSDMGFLCSSEAGTSPDFGPGQSISEFELSQQLLDDVERELATFPWEALTAEVDLYEVGSFEGDYCPQNGVTPGAYLLT